ncbi:hypothetical protein PG985_011840 [Apiospora marii]|uniref:uncharacterized protein n=1 Tax=Apiospora marii TaxID=335849 RepID=UPI0031302F89
MDISGTTAIDGPQEPGRDPGARRQGGTLDPNKYRKLINKHSTITISTSIFSGHEYEALANFLNETDPKPVRRHNDIENEAIAYTWLGEKEAAPKSIGRELPQFPSSSGTLVFLRGYQTPRRILEIGSAYRLDPEFFQRHLDFLHRSRRPKQSLMSRIPSSQKAILRLSITTVGRLNKPLVKNNINKARTEASRRMEEYLTSLRTHQHNSGASIVRTFAMHDLKEFSIEQMATIIICKKPKDNAWLCFVWLDAGDREQDDPMGPWLGDDSQSTVFEPIPLYRHKIALEHHWIEDPPFQPPHGHEIKQSIRSLPYFYGQKIHGLSAQKDPFYALNGLFSFVASSELFFLNLIEEQISRNMDSSVDKKSDAMESHANLAFFSRIIQEHVQHITNTLSTITSHPLNDVWPKQDDQTTESASIWLSRDMSSVLEKAEALQSACVRGMDVIMTRSSLEEAKLSVSQNQRVLKLTVLASFFAPLAFTTSLFGMNFVTPSTEQGPWLVVTIAAPLVTVALLILTWDQSFVENIVLTTGNVTVETAEFAMQLQIINATFLLCLGAHAASSISEVLRSLPNGGYITEMPDPNKSNLVNITDLDGKPVPGSPFTIDNDTRARRPHTHNQDTWGCVDGEMLDQVNWWVGRGALDAWCGDHEGQGRMLLQDHIYSWQYNGTTAFICSYDGDQSCLGQDYVAHMRSIASYCGELGAGWYYQVAGNQLTQQPHENAGL